MRGVFGIFVIHGLPGAELRLIVILIHVRIKFCRNAAAAAVIAHRIQKSTLSGGFTTPA